MCIVCNTIAPSLYAHNILCFMMIYSTEPSAFRVRQQPNQPRPWAPSSEQRHNCLVIAQLIYTLLEETVVVPLINDDVVIGAGAPGPASGSTIGVTYDIGKIFQSISS